MSYLENSSFGVAEYSPGYSVWFLDSFFSVSVLSKKNPPLLMSEGENTYNKINDTPNLCRSIPDSGPQYDTLNTHHCHSNVAGGPGERSILIR